MEVKLKAVVRTPGTHGDLTTLRRNGKLPATFYGRTIDAVSVYVDEAEFRKALETDAGTNVLINLDVQAPDGGASLKGKQTAIVRDIQRNPVKGDILHVDLQKVLMTEEIQATVPVVLTGEAAGVKLGGVLQHSIREVTVKSLPGNLPENFEIDISSLEVGDNVHVSDLTAVDDVEILDDPEEILVSVTPPTKVEEVVPAPEEEEAAEAAEPEVIGEKKEAEAEEG